MLHKSFKPAKCKTSLKLASSRIKLMKNKKGVQINQLKRDLAQLLQTGQDRTARIRVEHVIREEKMVAAYDLIEIYCELIAARLPIIESQKTCPIDLKEAVTSVIFAAPRCSDISELSDIRKQFTAKYGKEFVSAAIELRPDCGVSRMLVEKLSAVAPDLQTKIKVLSAVAKEHNIEWDPTSFEEKESKPQNDLLNGPVNIEKVSMINSDPPNIQASNIDGVHTREEKQDAPFDFAQQNRKYIVGTQNIVATDTDVRSSGSAPERMEMKQPFSRGGEDDFSSNRQHWNMEFKDATSAAQAAAESAERAAIAARAAAQFSSHEKIVKQYPSGSHVSNFKNETPRVSAPSGSIGEGHSKDSYENLSDDMKPKILSQQTGQREHDTSLKSSHGSYERSNIPTSFRSNNDPIKDEKLVDNFNKADQHIEESLHEDKESPSSPEMSTLEGSKEHKSVVDGGQKGSFESEDVNYFAEEASKNQQTFRTSHFHSSTSGDEFDVPGHQKLPKKSVVGNPFAFVDQGNLFRESTSTGSNFDAPRDDESMYDDDNGPRFDTGFEYDDVQATSVFMSAGRESPTRSLDNDHAWSPRMHKSNMDDQMSSKSHLFSESLSFQDHSVKSTGPSETDDHIPASFDQSDGPDSESESEMAKSSFSGKNESSSDAHNIFSLKPEPSFVKPSQDFKTRKSRIELDDLVERESSFHDSKDEEKKPDSQNSTSLLLGLGRHELKKQNLDQVTYDELEDNDNSLNQSNDLDVRKELNLGTLTGGLRNKGGLKFPPLTKSAATDASYTYNESVEESPRKVDQTSLQSSLDSRVSKMESKKPKSSSDSDSDDYSDKFSIMSSEKTSKQAKHRSLFAPPAAFFDDDDGFDPGEEVTKQGPSRVHLGSGLSRRTRGSPSVSYSKSHTDETEVKTVISSSSEDRKPSTYSYPNETPVEPKTYIKKSKNDSKQIPEPQPPLNPIRKKADSKKILNSSKSPPEHQVDDYEPTQRKSSESGKSKATRTPVLGSEVSQGENLVKKPSHVHPNLPDYDSLAARLQSLRNDHQ